MILLSCGYLILKLPPMNRWFAFLTTFLIAIGVGILLISRGVIGAVDQHHAEIDRLLQTEKTTQSIRNQRRERALETASEIN